MVVGFTTICAISNEVLLSLISVDNRLPLSEDLGESDLSEAEVQVII
jgi:hypothetical protein